MRCLGLILLGLLFVAPLGCSKKSEEKSDKSGKTTADGKSPDNKTANNTSKAAGEAPCLNVAGLTGENAALGCIPQNSIVMATVRTTAILNSKLVKSLPEDVVPLGKKLAEAQKATGIDLRTLERASIGLWPGDGHAMSVFGLGGPRRGDPPKRGFRKMGLQ